MKVGIQFNVLSHLSKNTSGRLRTASEEIKSAWDNVKALKLFALYLVFKVRLMKVGLIALLMLVVSFCRAQTPTLWGMTQYGGARDSGVIFNYNISSGDETVVYNFGSIHNDCYPTGSLLRGEDGNLYGTTGVLFRWNVQSGMYEILPNYDLGVALGYPIEYGNGLLYGITYDGGAFAGGTIFGYNTNSDSEIVLHSFGSDSDGKYSQGSLLKANNGLLYGMTSYGPGHLSSAGGVLFSYNITTNQYAVVHKFGVNDTDGLTPYGSLIQANNGLLYGVTYHGGTVGAGTIFSFNIETGQETILHNFSYGTSGQNPEGALVQTSNGILYGMTFDGGLFGGGQIFSYDIETSNFVEVHNFGRGRDGSLPHGSLLQASNGLLYGMTAGGGTYSNGVVFSYDILADTEIVLHNFDSLDGITPLGDLIEVDIPTNIRGITNTSLQISPNPTTGQFTIQLPNTQGNYGATVYNTLGQNIEEMALTQTQNTFNLSNQPTGVYFVRVQTAAGVVEGKVILVK